MLLTRERFGAGAVFRPPATRSRRSRRIDANMAMIRSASANGAAIAMKPMSGYSWPPVR
ncbi:MAG TPA: hypothetical protein VHV74_17730 [Pseudonocardiaceae bacterium]|nr:hypothetical protein [Pseudonocardiaceae bacterium]